MLSTFVVLLNLRELGWGWKIFPQYGQGSWPKAARDARLGGAREVPLRRSALGGPLCTQRLQYTSPMHQNTQRSTEAPLRRRCPWVFVPGGDPWGNTPPTGNKLFMGPCRTPEGTNTKVTSAEGHFCANKACNRLRICISALNVKDLYFNVEITNDQQNTQVRNILQALSSFMGRAYPSVRPTMSRTPRLRVRLLRFLDSRFWEIRFGHENSTP